VNFRYAITAQVVNTSDAASNGGCALQYGVARGVAITQHGTTGISGMY